jgi:hypothetical protein
MSIGVVAHRSSPENRRTDKASGGKALGGDRDKSLDTALAQIERRPGHAAMIMKVPSAPAANALEILRRDKLTARLMALAFASGRRPRV